MTPYELVCSRYILPFPLYPFQQEQVDGLGPLPRSALYWEPGLGKTAGSTVCALFHIETGAEGTVVLMPPILITTWSRWLAKIRRYDGSKLNVTAYKGSPAERKNIKLQGDFILMGLQIFKKDIERIERELGDRRIHVILDEAQAIKNVGSQNYKLFRDFTSAQTSQLLTGTPLSTPIDGYAYIKLVSPNIYRNLHQFEQIHIAERDFFNKPTAWRNLELLAENLLINADRKTKEQVLLDLPEAIVVPLEYDLAPAHQKLYRKMVEDQLLKLPDDQKIDLTQSSALYHAMGQVVMGWDHFSGEPKNVAAGFDLIEEVLDELGDKKLIVFANYRRTNAAISERFKCPAIFGEISALQKQRNLDKFIDDQECRLISIAPSAGGIGLDGMQHVCADVLFIEPPPLANYIQALSRVHRDGQRCVVTVRVASANNTVQQTRLKALAAQEELVQPLQGSKAELRAALFGDAAPVVRGASNVIDSVPISPEVSSMLRNLLVTERV